MLLRSSGQCSPRRAGVPMHDEKKEAIELIERLPDDVSTLDIIEELYFQPTGGQRAGGCGRGSHAHARRAQAENCQVAEIRWSLTAESDLREIQDFIARDSPLRAVALTDRLVEAVETLTAHHGSVGLFRSLAKLICVRSFRGAIALSTCSVIPR